MAQAERGALRRAIRDAYMDDHGATDGDADDERDAAAFVADVFRRLGLDEPGAGERRD